MALPIFTILAAKAVFSGARLDHGDAQKVITISVPLNYRNTINKGISHFLNENDS